MAEILCSTGALIGRPNGRDYKLLEQFAPQLFCDGFEFMMYSSWYDKAEQLVTDIQKMGLHIPVMHCEKHIGEAISKGTEEDIEHAMHLFQINCEIAEALGAGKLVLHLWDGMTSDMNFKNNLNAYQRLNLMAQEKGIDLLVENVVCNCEEPMKHWKELADCYPDIHFVFDTKMAAFHQQLEWIYAEEWNWLWEGGHIRHMHINDYGGGYKDWAQLKTLPIGKGHVDFQTFFDFIAKKCYTGDFTVEATAFDQNGNVDFDMLNRCFAYIRQHISYRV